MAKKTDSDIAKIKVTGIKWFDDPEKSMPKTATVGLSHDMCEVVQDDCEDDIFDCELTELIADELEKKFGGQVMDISRVSVK